jgi:hypothetical protein
MKKKPLAVLMALVLFGGSFTTGCVHNVSETEHETEETTNRRDRQIDPERNEPLHDLSSVDMTMTFDDFYAQPVDEPWVLANRIPFTNGNVNTYYSQFITDSAGNARQGDILNNVATIYRPRVRHYPAEQDGYMIYEISYSEIFPMQAELDYVSSMSTFWSYHNVGFLDYYTGTIYPHIDMNTDIDSYSITGNVIYNGQTYEVGYYEFREDEELTNEISYGDDGDAIWDLEISINSTVYIVVPTGYDGIVMYVYTTDDSDKTYEEARNNNTSDYFGASVFGEAGDDEEIENIYDYAFLSIAELG